MRRSLFLVASVALGAVGASALTACTLIVALDDKRPPSVVQPDAGPPGPCAALRESTGVACGASLLDYTGAPSDLVTCVNDAITGTKPCGAAGCISMPAPYPDACDSCRKVDGTWCGHELVGFPADDAELVVACAGGKATSVTACHACKGDDAGGASCVTP